MYVACRPLKVGKRTVQAGEYVPEAADWQECVRRSHLNLGWIKDDGQTAAGKPVSAAADVTEGSAAVKPKKKAKRAKKTETAS